MPKALTAEIVLDFQRPRNRRPQYLALENGEFVYLDDVHITKGTPLIYNYVATEQGDEAQILLTQDSIGAPDGWPGVLDSDGVLLPDKAEEIAQGINKISGIALTMAVERAHELGHAAELAARKARDASLARAKAVARVVSLCGDNQSETAHCLGIDKSRVSRLISKAQAFQATGE